MPAITHYLKVDFKFVGSIFCAIFFFLSILFEQPILKTFLNICTSFYYNWVVIRFFAITSGSDEVGCSDQSFSLSNFLPERFKV